jgi:hypothetical protein
LCVNCYYIGETTNFRNRFSTHKSCIINFKPLGKINSEVAEHFNLKGHNFKTNLKIIIFEKKKTNFQQKIDGNFHFRILGTEMNSISVF